MSSFMQTLFWGLIRYVLRLRYRVQVIGAEQLRTVTGPTLVMPNHPAYIDPPLLLSHVRLGRPLRPIVYAGIFRRPLLYPFMRLIGAFEVPDLGRQSHGEPRADAGHDRGAGQRSAAGRKLLDISVGPRQVAA